MISSAQWGAYNKAVESIVEGSRRALETELTEWVGGHPGAGTAEIRREAERMMRGRVQEADKAAAALAAQWYDAQGKAAGMRLDRAVTSVAFDEATVDRVAHYQAQKLEDGDIPGFIEMCSELVGNDAVRSLNATIMRNAARDKRKGVKFARVTSGRNTCPWCLMLAGRGAVYHTRESAGAMGQFHRHCSCKIVPSFSGNKYEVLVEGHDPKKIESRLKDVERVSGVRRGTDEFNREIEHRDPDWLFGDSIVVDYRGWSAKEKRRLEKQEKREHSFLTDHGFPIFPIPTDRAAPASIDLWMGGEFWELKSVTGDERRAGQRIDEAVSKWDRLHARGLAIGSTPKVVLDNSDGKADDGTILGEIKKKMDEYSDKGFSEAYLLGHDGKLIRIKSEAQARESSTGGAS